MVFLSKGETGGFGVLGMLVMYMFFIILFWGGSAAIIYLIIKHFTNKKK